jgi:hypothetical protein
LENYCYELNFKICLIWTNLQIVNVIWMHDVKTIIYNIIYSYSIIKSDHIMSCFCTMLKETIIQFIEIHYHTIQYKVIIPSIIMLLPYLIMLYYNSIIYFMQRGDPVHAQFFLINMKNVVKDPKYAQFPLIKIRLSKKIWHMPNPFWCTWDAARRLGIR